MGDTDSLTKSELNNFEKVTKIQFTTKNLLTDNIENSADFYYLIRFADMTEKEKKTTIEQLEIIKKNDTDFFEII